jgi:predicted DNA-binding transcriptional regulator AlpA
MTIPTAEARNKEIGKALKGQTPTPQSIPSTLENLIPRLELADLLRLTPRSLDRWAWQRKGPRRFKIGNKSYYDRADVEAWLERQKAKGFGEAA